VDPIHLLALFICRALGLQHLPPCPALPPGWSSCACRFACMVGMLQAGLLWLKAAVNALAADGMLHAVAGGKAMIGFVRARRFSRHNFSFLGVKI